MRRILHVLPIIFAFAACGEDPGVEPDASMTADAAPPPPPPPPDAGVDASVREDAWTPPAQIAWAACTDAGVECATISVPLDHDRPSSGPSIELHLERIPARAPDLREGVLFVNPGGPGAPSSEFVEPVAATYPRVRERYDVIGVDWRGTGASSPLLSCGGAEDRDRLRMLQLPRDTAEYQRITGDLAAACRDQLGDDFVTHVGTVDAAKDLDLVRRALGEETINYLGVSYGTVLGSAYATLYPRRVRAFVLDSVVKPTWTMHERIAEGTAAHDAAFERWLGWCSSNASSCRFHGGASVDQIRSAWDALIAQLDALDGMQVGTRRYGSSDLRATTLMLLYGPDDYGLGFLLDEVERGEAAAALDLADQLRGRDSSGSYRSDSDANAIISCNDAFGPERTTAEDFDAALASIEGSRFGIQTFADYRFCVEWPASGSPISLAAPTAPPMYLLNGEHDPATPPSWAIERRDALSNGSYLDLLDEPGHGMFRKSRAVTRIENFILDPNTEPGPFSCVDTPPLARTTTTSGIVTVDINIFSRTPRTTTTAVTVEVVDERDDRVLGTATSTMTATEFVRIPITLGSEPIQAYVRASAPGFIGAARYVARPIRGNAFFTVNLADESVFRLVFHGIYNPSLTTLMVVSRDCDRVRVEGATIEVDAPSGMLRYGQRNGTLCVVGDQNRGTGVDCDSLGINYPEGTWNLTLRKDSFSHTRRVKFTPNTLVWLDLTPER